MSTVRQGSQGPVVVKLQRLLNMRITPSPGLKVDGFFGPRTLGAVMDYQRGVRIDIDGVVGAQTWFYLLSGDQALAAPRPQVPPMPQMQSRAHQAKSQQLQASPVKPPVAPTSLVQQASRRNEVWAWTLEEKFTAALQRTVPKLPGNIRREFEAMISGQALAVMAGTLVLWAASHAFGLGEAIDVALLVLGVSFFGLAVFDVASDLGSFLTRTAEADTEQELDEAASHLARAIAVIGVAAFVALLAKVNAARQARARGGRPSMEPRTPPPEAKPPVPRSPAPRVEAPSSAPSRLVSEGSPAHATAETSFMKQKLPKGELEPGAVVGKVAPTINEMPKVPEGWSPIPQDKVNTFAHTPEPMHFKEGTKLYRVVGDGNNPNGEFWTAKLPASEAEWRAKAAVQGEWNGDGGYVEYTVPKGGLNAWGGTAAPQPAAKPGYVLSGGGDQIWVPANSLSPSAPMPTPWNR